MTLSLVGLLRSLSLFLSSLFHLIRNIGTPFPPYHIGRMQVNKNGVVRISVCRCNHKDVVITSQASFIDPECKRTNKSPCDVDHPKDRHLPHTPIVHVPTQQQTAYNNHHDLLSSLRVLRCMYQLQYHLDVLLENQDLGNYRK